MPQRNHRWALCAVLLCCRDFEKQSKATYCPCREETQEKIGLIQVAQRFMPAQAPRATYCGMLFHIHSPVSVLSAFQGNTSVLLSGQKEGRNVAVIVISALRKLTGEVKPTALAQGRVILCPGESSFALDSGKMMFPGPTILKPFPTTLKCPHATKMSLTEKIPSLVIAKTVPRGLRGCSEPSTLTDTFDI